MNSHVGQWWWHKWQNDGILSGQAGFESQDGLRLFSVQNCCQSILTESGTFSNNVEQTLPSSFLFPIIIYLCEIYQLHTNNVPKKGKNKSKRGRERPILKKDWHLQMKWLDTSLAALQVGDKNNLEILLSLNRTPVKNLQTIKLPMKKSNPKYADRKG